MSEFLTFVIDTNITVAFGLWKRHLWHTWTNLL